MNLADLNARLGPRAGDCEKIAMVRQAALQLAAVIGTIPVTGSLGARAEALAVTKVEESVLWAEEMVGLSK